MSSRSREVWLHITAGQGPLECAWAVAQILEKMRNEALAASLEFKTIEIEPGAESGTVHSALVSISGGNELLSFVASWGGTIQWVARSPWRPDHKRKNWFVGIDVIEPVDESRFDPKDVRWETMRASGPGGQHVNRTESAVRVTHLPTGLTAIAMEERSQHRNRKLALARLARTLEELNSKCRGEFARARWRAHQRLQRGSPVRVFEADRN